MSHTSEKPARDESIDANPCCPWNHRCEYGADQYGYAENDLGAKSNRQDASDDLYGPLLYNVEKWLQSDLFLLPV